MTTWEIIINAYEQTWIPVVLIVVFYGHETTAIQPERI